MISYKTFSIVLIVALLFTACGRVIPPERGGPYGLSSLCEESIGTVSECGDYIKLEHDNLGGGITWVNNGVELRCPVVGPDSMSPECKKLLETPPTCTKTITCKTTTNSDSNTTTSSFTTCPENPTTACTREYMPVCGKIGLNMGDTIYQTFDNKCVACASLKVSGYTINACNDSTIGRSYKSEDPTVCMRIKYACTEGQSAFSDETGCGCEPEKKVTTNYTTCPESRPEMCTAIYKQVCADKDNGIRCVKAPCPSTDKVTYSSACSACSDSKVYGYVDGACPIEQKPDPSSGLSVRHTVICENSDDIARAEQFGLTCVAACPAGQDNYMGQIAMRFCIQHYGEKELAQLTTCKKKSDCSSEQQCAYALRSTDGKTLSWSIINDINGYPKDALRCVPSEYSSYLLQSNGLTTVDENGRSMTAIA